jgi:hypothetical protein
LVMPRAEMSLRQYLDRHRGPLAPDETSWRHFAASTGFLQPSGVVGSRPKPAPRLVPPTAIRVPGFTISPRGNEGAGLSHWFPGAVQAAEWP